MKHLTLTWQEVEDAVSKARSAFERWRHVPLSERIHMVLEGMQYFKEHYGLTAVVCTQSLGRAKHFGQMLEAGTVFMNRCDYLDPALPWTGIKSSGKGVSLSKYGFHALTRRKGLHFRINTS